MGANPYPGDPFGTRQFRWQRPRRGPYPDRVDREPAPVPARRTETRPKTRATTPAAPTSRIEAASSVAPYAAAPPAPDDPDRLPTKVACDPLPVVPAPPPPLEQKVRQLGPVAVRLHEQIVPRFPAFATSGPPP